MAKSPVLAFQIVTYRFALKNVKYLKLLRIQKWHEFCLYFRQINIKRGWCEMRKMVVIVCVVILAQTLLFSEAFAQFTKTKRNTFWFVLPNCHQGNLPWTFEYCKRFLIVENIKGSVTLSIRLRELEFPHRPGGSLHPIIQTEEAVAYDIGNDLFWCTGGGWYLHVCRIGKILEVTTVHSFNEGESDIRVVLEVTDIDENWAFTTPPIIRLR